MTAPFTGRPLLLNGADLVNPRGFDGGHPPGQVFDRFVGTGYGQDADFEQVPRRWARDVLADLVRLLLLPVLPVPVKIQVLNVARGDNPVVAARIDGVSLRQFDAGPVADQQRASAYRMAAAEFATCQVEVPMPVVLDYFAYREVFEYVADGPQALLTGLLAGDTPQQVFARLYMPERVRVSCRVLLAEVQAVEALRAGARRCGRSVSSAQARRLLAAGWTAGTFDAIKQAADAEQGVPGLVGDLLWEDNFNPSESGLARIGEDLVFHEHTARKTSGRVGEAAVFVPWLTLLCHETDEARARAVFHSLNTTAVAGGPDDLISVWHDVLGPVAPWAYATGLTLEEAMVERDAGRLGEAQMRLLAGLRGMSVRHA